MTVVGIIVGLMGLAMLTGCASAHYIQVKAVEAAGTCATEVPHGDTLVGVALSGGGTRAALFGSAGLQALAGLRTADGASVIEKISHLSSVSGGSLAASYYVLKKPGKAVPVLDADGTLSEAYREFFDRYRTDLSQDIEGSLVWRQLLSFRWLNSALAARTLNEILVEKLYGNAKFEEVTAREKAGDAPGLIVNTTLYNNGRRLALTALPVDAFDYDFFADLERSLKERGREMGETSYIRARWKLLRPMTPLEIKIDICPAGLSGAATASASFPPLVGPLTLRVGDQDIYWHAGDGGLYENSGAESLILLYLKQLQAQRVKRVLLIALDSSFPFSVGERELSRRSLPFSLLTFDFSRIPSIMEERAATYQALFFRTLQIEGVFPSPEIFTVVVLRHTDAEWAPDLSDLPPACKAEPEPMKTPEEVKERISEIPTRLVLKSECDRELLATAATKLVDKNREKILDFMNRR